MQKIYYLVMSLSFVALVSCNDDKENGLSGSGNVPENSSSVLYSSGKERGHSYVDLGLPSGSKWATCNIGAATPQDYGNYYAWGETTTKENYSWYTYLDGNIEGSSDCGTDKDVLKGVTDLVGTQYDAAYVNWGGKWRMPTKAQQEELCDECYWVWTDSYNNSNVKGYIVYKVKNIGDNGKKICKGETPSSYYSLSDAHIFLPAAGYHESGGFFGAGADSYYWSSSLDTDNPQSAWCIDFYSDHMFGEENYDVYCDYDNRRYDGQSVRAVIL